MAVFPAYGLNEATGEKGFAVSPSSLDKRTPLELNAFVLYHSRHVGEYDFLVLLVRQHRGQMCQEWPWVASHTGCRQRPVGIDILIAAFGPDLSRAHVWLEGAAVNPGKAHGLAACKAFPGAANAFGIVGVHYKEPAAIHGVKLFLIITMAAGNYYFVYVGNIAATIKVEGLKIS